MSKYCKDKCIICGKLLLYGHKTDYCNIHLVKQQREEKLRIWKETGDTECKTQTTLRNCIRDYILEKQKNRCVICNNENIWNNKQINFILDHIDRDASNNWESNLRLICPNCDSQLDTYKSKNKNSARTYRKKCTGAEVDITA